jgi:hypothetical protein
LPIKFCIIVIPDPSAPRGEAASATPAYKGCEAASKAPSRNRFRGPFVLGFDGAETQAKAEGNISLSEMSGFATGPQVLDIIRGREMGHFAELFVFNDLTPISFRANRKRRIPAADKAAAGAGEKRECPPFHSEKR